MISMIGSAWSPRMPIVSSRPGMNFSTSNSLIVVASVRDRSLYLDASFTIM